MLSADSNIKVIDVADLGLFRRGDFENPTRTKGAGLTREFYAFVN